eukprot:3846719-Pleurochrysis_carterae.AAC.3
MLLHEQPLRRPGLLRPDPGEREMLVCQAKDVVRRGIEPMAKLPLRRGQVGRGAGKQERGVRGTRRRLVQGSAARGARGAWQWQGERHWQL